MKVIIATPFRRLGVTGIVWGVASGLSLVWAWQASTVWTTEEILMRCFALPGLLAIAVLTLTTACSSLTGGNSAAALQHEATSHDTGPFKAQVVGLQWLNPLQRRDYPTEWQLLWTLGLVKPNKDDEMVEKKPQKFSSVQYVSSVVPNMFNDSFLGIFKKYNEEIYSKFREIYVMDDHYFYTVHAQNPKYWRELHGIRVDLSIPLTDKLTEHSAAEWIREILGTSFAFYNVPNLSSANIPPDVHVTVGAHNAGFTSLNDALNYLQANPDKTAWVMSWDVPEFPKDNALSEGCVLLILAGPHFNTEREPLAWLGRPASAETKDFETKEHASKQSQAWKSALHTASEQAGVKASDLGYVIHDAGFGNEAAGQRLGRIGQTLTENLPELDFEKQTFNTAKLLGDMRAVSALTDVALAIAWTHQKGKPVLVAGTHELDHPTMIVVTPPAKPRIFDPEQNWFRARGEAYAYLPWWGMRKDVNWDEYQQGFSK